MKGVMRKLIVVLALGVFLFALVNLVGIYSEYKKGTDEYAELEQFANRRQIATAEATHAPTEALTAAPTEAPTTAPTEVPTATPTEAPTEVPTEIPTEAPTTAPTEVPTATPTEVPTEVPTEIPTEAPTEALTEIPTAAPTPAPRQVSASDEATEAPAEDTEASVQAKAVPTEQLPAPTEAAASDEATELPMAMIYEPMENPVDFESLKAINSDIVGWIEMEAIDVFYPIMQSTDNEYYLYRTFRKVNNIAGSVFMDCRNHPDFTDKNTIIYGHNMKNGSMFGRLKEYLEKPKKRAAASENQTPGEATPTPRPETLTAYERCPYFWIYTPEYIYQYEIYSVGEVGEGSVGFKLTFEEEADFERFLTRTTRNSRYRTGVTVDVTDSVVTLSTCTSTHDERLLVHGKLVKTYLAVPKADGYGEAATESPS